MTDSSQRQVERLPTGIPGLDTVLLGGFRKGRTYDEPSPRARERRGE